MLFARSIGAEGPSYRSPHQPRDTVTATEGNAIEQVMQRIATAESLAALDELRVQQLGKSGAITEQLKLLGKLPPGERKARGEQINLAKQQLTDAIAARKATLEEAEHARRLAGERIDVTMPGRGVDP